MVLQSNYITCIVILRLFNLTENNQKVHLSLQFFKARNKLGSCTLDQMLMDTLSEIMIHVNLLHLSKYDK